jgi:hypothetical protein
MEKPIIAPEMRIYDQQGKRLYLSREERGEFLDDLQILLFGLNMQPPKMPITHKMQI